MSWRDGYIAVDWGTTNRRAYAVAADGRVTQELEDECGILAMASGEFEGAARDLRDRLGDRPMLLAGMVGSNRGWAEAPYVPCPAGAAEIARAIRWIEPGRTGIVPGVSQAGADVMRGEEVQVIGAAAAGMVPKDGLVCHPGTHAKWLRLEGGRIVSFQTMMTGEMFALLSKHSILSDQLQGEVSANPEFLEGAAAGLARDALLSDLFRIRARHLLGESGGDSTSYASGLLIGSDVRCGLHLHSGGEIALVGRPDLCALYAAVLGQAGQESIEVDGAAAFLAGMTMLTEML